MFVKTNAVYVFIVLFLPFKKKSVFIVIKLFHSLHGKLILNIPRAILGKTPFSPKRRNSTNFFLLHTVELHFHGHWSFQRTRRGE